MKKLLFTLFIISSPLFANSDDRFELGYNNAKNETIYRIGRDVYNTELYIRDLQDKLIDCKNKFEKSLREEEISFQNGKLKYYLECYRKIDNPLNSIL